MSFLTTPGGRGSSLRRRKKTAGWQPPPPMRGRLGGSWGSKKMLLAGSQLAAGVDYLSHGAGVPFALGKVKVSRSRFQGLLLSIFINTEPDKSHASGPLPGGGGDFRRGMGVGQRAMT